MTVLVTGGARSEVETGTGLPVGQQSTKTTAQPGSPVADLCCQHPAVHLQPHPADDPDQRPPPRTRRPVAGPARACAGADEPGPPTQRRHLACLAAGFGVGLTTVWRRLTCSADAADGAAAAHRAARLTYVIFDGTLIPIDRVADQKPYHSGKHQRQGVNV